MFWQSIVCGLGGAIGACIGFGCAALLWQCCKYAVGLKDEKKREYNEEAYLALVERNDLTRVTHIWLENIADAITRKQ